MRNGDWMQTYTGRAFWPLDPRADEIDIEDIAHALAMQCRFAGHSTEFYSVAEHCCHVSDRCPPELALWGLLHDASEAYLTDVVRPIKPWLTGYRDIEQQVMRCVIKRFGLLTDMPAEVKQLDNAILANERDQIMARPPMDWQLGEPPIADLILPCWNWRCAEIEFMARFQVLYARLP